MMREAQPARPGGIYVFERHVLERVSAAGFQDIKQGLLERLYAHGEKVAVHEVSGLSPRVLDFHSYASVSSWLITSAVSRRAAAREQEMLGAALDSLWLDGAGDELSPVDAPLTREFSAWRGLSRHEPAADGRSFVPFAEWEQVEDALVHPTATVHPSARLIGPVLVGPYACVEADAVVVGPTSLGAGTVVEADAVIARSELLARVRVGSGAQVDGSVVADGVVVAPQRHVAGAVLTGPTRIPSTPVAAPTPSPSAASNVTSSSRSTPVAPLAPVSRSTPATSVAPAAVTPEGARRSPAPPISLSPLHTPPS
jgi:mannose-1-phosphate guanylyltransferase